MKNHRYALPAWMTFSIALLASSPAAAQTDLPRYLNDRGASVRTSIFGTYVRSGELLVSPFYEHYFDRNLEYKPSELGYAGNSDHRGRYRAAEGLVFLSYGVTDWLAVEYEVAVIRASLWKSAADGSPMPAKLSESGRGDMQAQLDFRFLRENERRPELFGYFEVVFPSNRKKNLIGTPDWELKGGGGIARGFGWGTLTVRAAAEHSRAERKTELGEYAIEYLRRLSPGWRLYTGIEGTQDEVEFITEFQWHLSDRLYIRINNGFGVTSKATDWAPDIGIVFSLPTR